MATPMLIVLAILAGAVALWSWGRPRADIVGILVVVALLLSGVLTPQESFAGFGDPVVILIAAVFIVGAALENTGIVHRLSLALLRLGGWNEARLLVLVVLIVGALTAFMSSTAASEADAEGHEYTGANRYVMHFDAGQLPPADGFRSMTMYDDGYFFVDNPLNRYNVSSRSPFVKNADGSVDIYIQKDNPGKSREANWLPAPAGKFVLMLRLYRPRVAAPSILDGSWKIPPVKKVVSAS